MRQSGLKQTASPWVGALSTEEIAVTRAGGSERQLAASLPSHQVRHWFLQKGLAQPL